MLQDQFGAATRQEQDQLSELKARMSSQLLPFRDSNGFRKLVVLLTEPGAAFHTAHHSVLCTAKRLLLQSTGCLLSAKPIHRQKRCERDSA